MKLTARTLFMAAVLVLTLGVAAPAQAGKADPVPIKGTLVGAETGYPAGSWDFDGYFFTLATEFDIDGDGQADYTCGEDLDPPGAQELVVGSMAGTLSHLGKVTREMSYCIRFDYEGFRLLDYTLELTAANGDTVDLDFTPGSDYQEERDDGLVDYGGELTFAGGTGRFVGASGTLMESGLSTQWNVDEFPYTSSGSDPWTRQMSATYTGEISYDASNRAAK